TIRAAAGDIEGSVREPDEEPPRLVPEEAPEGGEALGRIVAPAANLDAVMVEGVERWQLKLGPGHFPGTPMPGQPGNAVISGHRTTYGAPFYDLHLLQPGDEIVVETAIGKHVYQVRESLVVEPDDVWVLDDREGAWLTLTTCHPQFSARQRLVVFAEMVGGPNLLAVAATSSS
ncbi:MAG: class E sortase, partial [Actinomycetota bacterium]|nr:class E sortase [Actinomycetota bacterium]